MAQRADFVEILEAMDGLPVTVRLLDPPLHEFLPRPGSWPSRRPPSASTDEEQALFEAAKQWHEFNPMLGTRGVRLGVSSPASTPCRSGPSWRRPSTGWRPAASRSSRS